MVGRRLWTEGEIRKALSLYLRTAFGRIDQRNPEIMALAEEIGRTVSSVALKLVNLAALDDSLPQKGMANVSAADRRVWQAFLNNPESLFDTASYSIPVPDYRGFADAGSVITGHATGIDLSVSATRRVGQALFREAVLTSYKGRCGLTGIEDARLLNASHIVGWADAPDQRMNFRNGICLGALHDRAFDRHLIAFADDWRLLVRSDVPDAARNALLRGAGSHLRMPERFLPDPDLIARHRQVFDRAAA